MCSIWTIPDIQQSTRRKVFEFTCDTGFLFIYYSVFDGDNENQERGLCDVSFNNDFWKRIQLPRETSHQIKIQTESMGRKTIRKFWIPRKTYFHSISLAPQIPSYVILLFTFDSICVPRFVTKTNNPQIISITNYTITVYLFKMMVEKIENII